MRPRSWAGGKQSPTKTPGGCTIGWEPGAALCCRSRTQAQSGEHSTTCMVQAGVNVQDKSNGYPCAHGKGHPSHHHQPQPCEPSVPVSPHPVTPPSPATELVLSRLHPLILRWPRRTVSGKCLKLIWVCWGGTGGRTALQGPQQHQNLLWQSSCEGTLWGRDSCGPGRHHPAQ